MMVSTVDRNVANNSEYMMIRDRLRCSAIGNAIDSRPAMMKLIELTLSGTINAGAW
jgi:hypothetical protein